MPFYPFLGEVPYQNRLQEKKDTLMLTSLLEDLKRMPQSFQLPLSAWVESNWTGVRCLGSSGSHAGAPGCLPSLE